MSVTEAKRSMIVTIGNNVYKVVALKKGVNGGDNKLYLNRIVHGEVVPFIHRIAKMSEVCTVALDGVIHYKVEKPDGSIGFIKFGEIK
ncbi:hypothetical protein BRC2024_KCUCJSVR_CDS_0100 [Acinetobacter phage vB_AbaM_KissB]